MLNPLPFLIIIFLATAFGFIFGIKAAGYTILGCFLFMLLINPIIWTLEAYDRFLTKRYKKKAEKQRQKEMEELRNENFKKAQK